MIGCSEWTGVPLSTLLDEVGLRSRKAKFLLAEGADGASLTRTIPIAMALDDVIVVYGQNGEMLRPEQGYPLRLLVPGVQGVSSVKWLRRIEVGDAPWNTREESLHYVDLMPGGMHRQYTWIQEAKSVITAPSGGQVLLDRGYHEITGLAWSGRGKVKRVDVSTDGGRNWRTARLQEPVLTKALTRFRIDWTLGRRPGAAAIARRSTRPATCSRRYRQLRAVRGTRSIYHNNAIQTWRVDATGEVSNVQVAVTSPALLDARSRWRSRALRLRAGGSRRRASASASRADAAGDRRLGHRRAARRHRPARRDAARVAQGQEIYDAKCASCHGTFGESNDYMAIAGGVGHARLPTSRSARPAASSTTRRRCGTTSVARCRSTRRKTLTRRRGLRADRVRAAPERHPARGRRARPRVDRRA